MKIALVIPHLDPSRGGAEQWTAQYARWLVASGHRVCIVAHSVASSIVRDGIEFCEVPAAGSRVGFAEAAERCLDRVGADVVHDQGAGWRADLLQPHGGSRTAAQQQNLNLVSPLNRVMKRAAARCLPRYRDFDRLLQRQYEPAGKTFIALSQMVADDMVRYHGVSLSAIRVVYNGVDTDRFSPDHRAQWRTAVRRQLGLPDHVALGLIVAHNFALKGLPTLIEATGRLASRHASFHLAVVGQGSIARARRHAKRAGASDSITFVGATADPRPYYAAADMYLHPTWYDPCSLTLLEALASGLPVVTTRFNGAGELLRQGVEGYVLDDPADVDRLEHRIGNLLDADRRQTMGQAARRLALDHTFDHNARELLALYGGRNRVPALAA